MSQINGIEKKISAKKTWPTKKKEGKLYTKLKGEIFKNLICSL